MRLINCLCCTLVTFGFSQDCFALDSWTCEYPGFNAGQNVTVQFVVKGNELLSEPLGVPVYELLEDNEYAVIAVEHSSKFDQARGAVRIFSSTVIIDKTSGKFIYTVGEIGEQPRYRTGQCAKD
jgi:hypothetical protein